MTSMICDPTPSSPCDHGTTHLRTTTRCKVVMAMSGGVDSSVAACLLCDQGYDVLGLFMRVGDHGATPAKESRHQGCCSASDAADARYVAGMLAIPFFALNFEEDFRGLIDAFADEYAAGRTPNPCVVCNQKLKFGKVLSYADAVGARYVATGHYARVERRDDGTGLRRALDRRKDQSYVMAGLRPDVLDRVLFPLGDWTKEQVRAYARAHGLPNADKPDSVEICFAPDRDYARVVRDRRPDAFREGDVVTSDGRVVGRHQGIGHYTVGQRRGLGIALGLPVYVTRVDAASNTITLGIASQVRHRGLRAEGVNVLRSGLEPVFRADVKIRYLHEAAPATVERVAEREFRVLFDDPQTAPTPGQAVVFYDGDSVLAGGCIAESFDA